MSHDFLFTGPRDAEITIVLAQGAGGAMDTTWMENMSSALADKGLRVFRFEFDYMAARRSTGQRSPPPRAELLKQEYETVIDRLDSEGTLGHDRDCRHGARGVVCRCAEADSNRDSWKISDRKKARREAELSSVGKYQTVTTQEGPSSLK